MTGHVESTLLAVFVVSLVSFAGVFALLLRRGLLKTLLPVLVSFSAGALLGAALLDMLPKATELVGDDAFVLAFAGVVLFLIIERFISWHHYHHRGREVHSFTYLNLLGDGVHNFVDGMAIAASFIASPQLGAATTLAVLLHEIPQEIGDIVILVYGGLKRSRALFYNFVTALTAFLGAAIVLFLAPSLIELAPRMIALTAGGFIYIATVDLIPELHRERSRGRSMVQLLSLIFGALLIAFITRLLTWTG